MSISNYITAIIGMIIVSIGFAYIDSEISGVIIIAGLLVVMGFSIMGMSLKYDKSNKRYNNEQE